MPDQKKPKRVREDAEYIAFVQRAIRGLEARAIADPSILSEVLLVVQRLAEVPNVVLATSAVRYANNPMAAPSAGEIARVLGITKQSASERRKLGDRTLFERQMGEATIPQRERAARTKSRQWAEKTMAEWLDRKDSVTS